MLVLSNAIGSMQAINAAGYAVEQRDGTLFGVRISDGATGQDVDAAIQAIDDAYPVRAAADIVCAQIEALAEAKRGAVYAAGNFGVFEAGGWALKLREANAYTASGDPNDAPFLQREATRGGITLANLVNRVLTNAALLAPMEADIAGEARRHKDAVRSLTTHADIAAYDYTTGWPL